MAEYFKLPELEKRLASLGLSASLKGRLLKVSDQILQTFNLDCIRAASSVLEADFTELSKTLPKLDGVKYTHKNFPNIKQGDLFVISSPPGILSRAEAVLHHSGIMLTEQSSDWVTWSVGGFGESISIEPLNEHINRYKQEPRLQTMIYSSRLFGK